MGVNLVFLKGAELTEQGLLSREGRGIRAGAVSVSSVPESPPGQGVLSITPAPSVFLWEMKPEGSLFSTEERGFLRKENMPWRHKILNLKKTDLSFPFP